MRFQSRSTCHDCDELCPLLLSVACYTRLLVVALPHPQSQKLSPDALADTMEEMRALLGTDMKTLKDDIAGYFEKLLEETARMVDQATDKGLHRNITNLTFRKLWRDFFSGAGETVTHETFASGIENFMLDELLMAPDDVAALWNKDAQSCARLAIDRDGDGCVSVAVSLPHQCRCDALKSFMCHADIPARDQRDCPAGRATA